MVIYGINQRQIKLVTEIGCPSITTYHFLVKHERRIRIGQFKLSIKMLVEAL